MQILSALEIGAFHTLYCEDARVHEPLSDRLQLLAVMDGCTMGRESVFASLLLAKIIRKQAKEAWFKDFYTPKEQSPNSALRQILKAVWNDLKKIKNELALDQLELLSTLILAVIEQQTGETAALVVGDDLIVADEKIYEFEQGDKPDYLAYHLAEPFEAWLENQEQWVHLQKCSSLALASDGIFSFKNLARGGIEATEKTIVNALLVEKPGRSTENPLGKKIRQLREEGWVPTDDLAIVRMIR